MPAIRRLGRRPRFVASAWVSSAASVYARALYFAPSGESLLSNATKGTKKSCPGHSVFRLGEKFPR